jgi:hypothetical protein
MLDADTDVVLRRTRHRGGQHVVHLPSDDDCEQPACGQALRLEDAAYTQVPADRIRDSARLCKYCDPDHEVEKGTTGTPLASLLEDAGSDLVSDGGETVLLPNTTGQRGGR